MRIEEITPRTCRFYFKVLGANGCIKIDIDPGASDFAQLSRFNQRPAYTICT
ncbi:hypothetical protein D3C71_1044650 [compost metagenome]